MLNTYRHDGSPNPAPNFPEMLRYSHGIWIPKLQSIFLQLAVAIRMENLAQLCSMTSRIRKCAVMGGAHDIVNAMNQIDSYARYGRWLAVRGEFRDARYMLSELTQQVAVELKRAAS
jgi:hypothetical protein